MGNNPVHGFYHGDSRVLRELVLHVDGEVPEAIACSLAGASSATFVALARGIDDRTADPRVRIERVRDVQDGALSERITLTNGLATDVTARVSVRAVADFSSMEMVKAGLAGEEPPAGGGGDGSTVLPDGERGAEFTFGALTATLRAPGATVAVDGMAATLTWSITVPARSTQHLAWGIDVVDGDSVVAGAAAGRNAGEMATPEWAGVRTTSADPRLAAWVTAALVDLDALRMTVNHVPEDPFLAAGAPWFFTLFGRDSLWSARFLLPLGTGLAASTLRVLARLQGTEIDPESAEEPGKIMHELRSGTLVIPGEDVSLPPLYYGTVDATALWIVLLHDAWTWGMPDDQVEELLPNLEAALAWMRDYGDSDGDGFLEYADTSGHGLANQGWKDSGDSIQWRDGRLAEGPIALCEVQAYAYEAAIGGADLLDAFGRNGGDEWRDWAATLKARFAESFWVSSPDGDYPAVALDVHKQRVDTVTSNIGHLLGTGLLDGDESRLVARRLVSPELNSGYGLRTMSTDSAGYWPLSYHGGSVWAHDTAIAITGLRRAGFPEEAAALIDGLLAAAEGFDYRMPELHSGDASTVSRVPIPYPAACRPQAWSAGASVAVLAAALGLRPDGEGVSASPIPIVGAISVGGLCHRDRHFTVTTDEGGHVTSTATA